MRARDAEQPSLVEPVRRISSRIRHLALAVAFLKIFFATKEMYRYSCSGSEKSLFDSQIV
jgi:hypothetical protein